MAIVTYYTGTPRLTLALKKKIVDGVPRSPRIQRFDAAGYLSVDEEDPQGKEIIELLDSDKRYGKVFRRQSDDEKKAIAITSLEPHAEMPNEGAIELLSGDLIYLEEKMNKDAFAPMEVKKMIGILRSVFDVCKIVGIKIPSESDGARKLKSVIFAVLDLLETKRIYKSVSIK
jgi:hypothetical protein